MAHVVHELPWCDIDIDTTTGKIFLQQRWNYNWILGAGMPPWTAAEKTNFHNRADQYIWAAWSNRAILGVSGSSQFSKSYSATGVPINLDIRRVTAKEHWNVNAKKIAAGAYERSNVLWHARIINLDTNDFQIRNNCLGLPRVCYQQKPVAHEFGHTVGNTAVLRRGDEYGAGHVYVNDHGSMMNVGSQLRDRHFQTILDELNKMIPDTVFTVKRII